MKPSMRRWLSLAIVPAALALFGAVAPAQATTFECPGPGVSNPIPSTPFQGSIEVDQASGDCTIDYDIEATGTIDINVQNGVLNAKKITSTTSAILLTAERNNVTTLDLTAGTFLRVLSGLTNGATTGNIDIQGPLVINATEVQSGPPTTHGNVLIRAYGNVKTMDISTGGNKPGGGAKTGGVQIDAHLLSGQNVLFTIGADTANGVNGTISTETVTGGGTTGTGTILGGVRITNGVAGSTGGITVVQMNKIKVRASESRSGWIQLNARDGVLTLPTNKLNADGMTKVENPGQPNEMTTHYMAGAIFLAAKTIETEDGTVISASQDPMASGSVHQVVIAAEEIKFKGADGLKIKADGNGVSQTPFQPATVYVLPKGGINPTSTGDQNNVTNLLWTLPFNGNFFQFPGKVFFNGDASAPLLISNDGNHTQTAMTGYPFEFKGGKVTITALGNLNHQIVMGYFGAYDGTKGLSFDNTGLVKINASGKKNGDAGGRIQIQTDVISMKAIAVDPDPDMPPNDPRDILIKADGPSTGDGNGGQIFFIGSQFNLDPVSKARISADGAKNGTGNAIASALSSNGPHAVTFTQTGSSLFEFGGGAGRFKISATGGKTAGNAGSVKISTGGSILFTDANKVIDASASETGTSGNGGAIQINAISVVFPTDPTKVAINARGSETSGEGGIIEILASSSTAPSLLPINVNTIMKVDGDSSQNLLISDGQITINDIMCRQFKTAFNYPESFWDCGPRNGSITGQGSTVATAASSLEPQLQNILKDRSLVTPNNKSVQVYAMRSIDDFSNFFSQPGVVGSSGIYGIGNNPSRVAIAFVSIHNGPNGPLQPATSAFPPANSGSPTIMQGSIIHELGHHLDYIWGNVSSEQTHPLFPAFDQARNDDLTRLLNSGFPLPRGACSNAFTVATCNANAVDWGNLTNLAIYGDGNPNANPPIAGLKYSTLHRELFPIVLEHLESVRTGQFAVMPDLERAVLTQFLDMKAFIQGLINNPPPSVN